MNRQTNYGLHTEQVHTFGEQTNDRTGAETGLKPKQRHVAKHKQKQVEDKYKSRTALVMLITVLYTQRGHSQHKISEKKREEKN